MYNILVNKDLQFLPIWLQCTWARVFEYPEVNKGFCIRTYNIGILIAGSRANFNNGTEGCIFDPAYKKFTGMKNDIKTYQLGELTGNYYIDPKNVKWLEARILYCDRRPTGWFRERDIWHSLKGVAPNERDWEYIPYTPADPTNPGAGTTKNTSWLAWLTGGIALLSSMR